MLQATGPSLAHEQGLHCVIGLVASMGGLDPIFQILSVLPADLPAAVIVLRHRGEDLPNYSVAVMQARTPLVVKEAEHGDVLRDGVVYNAPPGIHLTVEANDSLSLDMGPKVKYVRPSGDLLFQSMAWSLKERAIVVVLSGLSTDGSGGLASIRGNGGIVITQSPTSAVIPSMPMAALETGCVDYTLPADLIGIKLVSLARRCKSAGELV